MTYKNEKDMYIEAHNDSRGTSHMNFYDGDPREPHESIHINIKEDGTGTIVEKDRDGNKETTHIDLKK